MIFKVGGQRSAKGTVERCGDRVPPGSERSRTRGNRKGSVAGGPGTELKKCEAQARATEDRWAATHRNCSVDNWRILSEDRLFDIFDCRRIWLSSLGNRGFGVNILVLLLCGRSGCLHSKFCGCWYLTI